VFVAAVRVCRQDEKQDTSHVREAKFEMEVQDNLATLDKL
jgi:hypothetical protein